MKLAIHTSTERVFQELQHTLPQALLLAGVQGVGLKTIALRLADTQLMRMLSPTNKDGELDAISGSITIEEVRALYGTTKGKSTSAQIVIIDDADKMTRQAQNAFLKLLEEPPVSVHFILTAHTAESLLPTIRSRLQIVHIPPITMVQSKAMVVGQDNQKQLLFIAAGRPAELYKLINQPRYFEQQSKLFTRAKNFLHSPMYQKIIILTAIKSRTEAIQFIDTVVIVVRVSLASSARPETIHELSGLLRARDQIIMNGSLKLQLLRAVV